MVTEGILLSTFCILLFSVVEGFALGLHGTILVFDFMSAILVCGEFHSKLNAAFVFMAHFNSSFFYIVVYTGIWFLYLPLMFYTFVCKFCFCTAF